MPIQKHIFLFLLLFLSSSVGQAQDYQYILEEQNLLGAPNRTLFYDLNGDGFAEQIDVQKDGKGNYSIKFYDKTVETGALDQINFPNRVVYSKPFIFTQTTGRVMLIVTVIENDSTFLLSFDVTDIKHKKLGEIYVTSGTNSNGDEFWDGSLEGQVAVDLNDDSFLDVVLTLTTGLDKRPRGVYAVDVHNNKILWYYPSGAYYNQVSLGDLNRDQSPEIYLGSAAMGNGVSENGTSDSLSYATVLDKNGHCLFNRDFGTYPSQTFVYLADFNGDGQKELLTILSSRNDQSSRMGKIIIWNGMADSPKMTIQLENVHLTSVNDIDNDGSDELIVVVGSSKEKIKIFKNSKIPHLIKEIKITCNKLKVADLVGDANKEIILSGSKQTIVLNHKLEQIAHTNTGGRILLKNQGPNNHPLLVISNQYLNFFKMRKNSFFNKIANSRLFFAAIILLPVLLVFVLILIIILKSENRNTIRIVLDTVPWPAFVFNKKAQLVIYNQQATKITPKLNWQKVHEKQSEYEKSIAETLAKIRKHQFKTSQLTDVYTLSNGKRVQLDSVILSKNIFRPTYILLFLRDTTFQKETENVLQWSAMSQRLAHDIKNPLSIIKLTLQRLNMSISDHHPVHEENYVERINSALEEVDRLRKATDGFMKLAQANPPQLKEYPVIDIIEEIRKQIKSRIPDGVDLSIEVEKNLPSVCVDLEQIVVLFSNLTENAIRAMKGKGALSLTVHLFDKIEPENSVPINPKVVFELTDSGCGIQAEKLTRVFEPFFSEGKGGTGLGLLICKRIAQDHNGKISISSKVGLGTTIRIELPIKKAGGEE